MKLDFRYEYRILRKKAFGCRYDIFIIQTRAWWRPWWKTLNGYDLFDITELKHYEFKVPIEEYGSQEAAEEMANLYARNGRMAFVKSEIVRDIKYLGKLP